MRCDVMWCDDRKIRKRQGKRLKARGQEGYLNTWSSTALLALAVLAVEGGERDRKRLLLFAVESLVLVPLPDTPTACVCDKDW